MAKKDFEIIKALAQNLVQREIDTGNVEMMEAVAKMEDGDWELEDPPDWFINQPASDPYDALKDTQDMFGNMKAKLSITPYSGGDDAQQNADKLEQALMWELDRALGRRGDSQRETTHDAFAFGRTASQVVYLPYMKDTMKVFGDEKRYKAALRNGKFAIIHKDARTVFPNFTDYYLEGVLTINIEPSNEVINFWGDYAGPIKKNLKENESLKWCTVYDYWSLDQRCVWVQMHEAKPSSYGSIDGDLLFNEDNKLPFLPWVVSDLGSKLKPLLYPVFKFNYWHTMCLMESAQSSEVQYYIAAPRLVVKNGELFIDYGEPGRVAELKGLNADYDALPPPGLDPGLSQMVDKLRARLSKSTISHTVQTGDFGSNNPYAAIREMIDLEMRRLNDGKRIIEKHYEEIYKQYLYWLDFTGDKLNAFGERREGGQIVVSPPAEYEKGSGEIPFDPDRLYFKVTMTPDIPEDQVAKYNAAMLLYQLGASLKSALEVAGISDPTGEIEKRMREDIIKAKHEASIQSYMATQQGKTELALQIEAQKLMEAMSQGQGGAAPGGPGPGGPPPGQGGGIPQRATGRGNENLRADTLGQGTNPALGGSPPDIFNPGTSSPEVQGPRNVEGGNV